MELCLAIDFLIDNIYVRFGDSVFRQVIGIPMGTYSAPLLANCPYNDSNIPANPAYGVYISQLVRYARICTSKLDFIHRLRQLSTRLLHQGFKSTLLGKSLAKFFKRHDAIEMRLSIQD